MKVTNVLMSRRCSEQGDEAFLLEVSVCRQGVGEPALAHEKHRPTIRQAVALIRTGLVQGEAPAEHPSVLRHHDDTRIAQDGLDHLDGRRPDVRALVGQCVQELGQDGIGGDEATAFQCRGNVHGLGMMLVKWIGEREPVGGVREDRVQVP